MRDTPERTGAWVSHVVTHARAAGVARFFLGVQKRFLPADPSIRLVSLNGRPGAVAFFGSEPYSAFSFDCSPGGIARIYVVRNPDKLRHLAAAAAE